MQINHFKISVCSGWSSVQFTSVCVCVCVRIGNTHTLLQLILSFFPKTSLRLSFPNSPVFLSALRDVTSHLPQLPASCPVRVLQRDSCEKAP